MNKQIDELDRAKIFMPFDALKGLREALNEKEKIIVQKKNLSEEVIEENSKVLKSLKKGQMVEVIYYDNEQYIKLCGVVSKIELNSRFIQIVEKKIELDSLYEIKVIA